MKTIPIIKKDNITGRGVRIGCHAFNLCCLNAVSNHNISNLYAYSRYILPGRLDCEELSLEDILGVECGRMRMEKGRENG